LICGLANDLPTVPRRINHKASASYSADWLLPPDHLAFSSASEASSIKTHTIKIIAFTFKTCCSSTQTEKEVDALFMPVTVILKTIV